MHSIKKSIAVLVLTCLAILPLTVSAQTAMPTPQSVGGASTDLSVHLSAEIDSRINGADPSSSLPIFPGVEPTFSGTAPFTYSSTIDRWARNASSWTKRGTPIDFTGVAGWNDQSGLRGAATLITRRHYVTADHLSFPVGAKVTFFTSSGAPVTRTVTDFKRIGTTDIHVGQLDSDVPSSIVSYPIMSYGNMESQLQSTYFQKFPNVPILIFNQYRETLIYELDRISSYDIGFVAPSGVRGNFYKSLITGDSGQPIFLVINGQAVLISTNYTPFSGPTLGAHISEINQAIVSMGAAGYSARVFDSSVFTKNTLEYAAPRQFSAVPPPGSCIQYTSDAKVTLEWTIPNTATSYKVANYELTDNAGSPIIIQTSFISNLAYPTTLKYIVDSLAPGSSHTFVLKAKYGTNVSPAVSATVVMPPLCTASGSVSNPAATPTATPTATASVIPVVVITPPASGQVNGSGSSNVQGGGSSGSYSSGGSTGSYYSGSGSSGIYYQGTGGSTYYPYYGSDTSVTQPNISNNYIGSATVGGKIRRNIKVGDMGGDVYLLQVTLNKLGYTITTEGAGSPGNETAYFGTLTGIALNKYQEDRSETGVIPSGILDNVTISLINADIQRLNVVSSVSPVTATSSAVDKVKAPVGLFDKIRYGLQKLLHFLKIY
ncbi:MAG: peptidoglycan-binding domain-containing protein [Candidatus Paceibacterota bacterium]